MNPFGPWNLSGENGISYKGADSTNIQFNNLDYIGFLIRDYNKNGDAYNAARL